MADGRLRRGQNVFGWVVDEVLHVGGVASYRAHKEGAPTVEALLETAPRDARDGLRLRREAYALRGLEHPALPRLLDKGELDGGRTTWVATEWFEGELLGDVLRETTFRWEDAATLFHQLAEGLLVVHQHGLVHRDIHPGKIQVSARLRARLVGFELAMTAEELERVQRPPLGDLAYVAPEVIADRNHHGPRADLYSLGVVFYEVLTGTRAFPAALWGDRADPEARMIAWKSRADALDPGPDVPSWLRNLVRKATHPDPDKRLPDLDAMVGWLEAARESWATPAAPERVAAPRPAAPPPLVNLEPSIGAAGMSPTATLAPIPANDPLPLAMAYAVMGTLGAVVGIALGVLILVLIRQPIA